VFVFGALAHSDFAIRSLAVEEVWILMNQKKGELNIRDKIEKLMGWKSGLSRIYSLRALQIFVRGKDDAFDKELSLYLDSGAHVFVKDDPPKHKIDYPHVAAVWYLQEGYEKELDKLEGYTVPGWYFMRDGTSWVGPYPSYEACWVAANGLVFKSKEEG
jgi:hypothetical protein